MRSIFKLYFFLLLLCSCSENDSSENKVESSSLKQNLILGERIDGPANIRAAVNGKLIFELNDNLLVETSPLKNNWYEIGVFVDIDSIQYATNQILPESDLMINGKKVGVVKDTIEILMSPSENEGLIWGYTYKENIKKETIPEIRLSELVNSNKLTKEDHQFLLDDFKFEKLHDSLSIGGIEQYFIYQSLMVDPSPRDRITILYRNNILVGIIHSREINLNRMSKHDLIRGHILHVSSQLSIKEIETLKKEKIGFYGVVD